MTLLVLLCLPASAGAAPADVDTAFGVDGTTAWTDEVAAVAPGPGGGAFVVRTRTFGQSPATLRRITARGSLDLGFPARELGSVESGASRLASALNVVYVAFVTDAGAIRVRGFDARDGGPLPGRSVAVGGRPPLGIRLTESAVYVTTEDAILATDRATGRALAGFGTDGVANVKVAGSGIAASAGMLVVPTPEGLAAFDADTGAPAAGFDGDGRQARDPARRAVGSDAAGRIVVVEGTGTALRFSRLSPSGADDPAYGSQFTLVPFPGGATPTAGFGQLQVVQAGRGVLVGYTFVSPGTLGETRVENGFLVLDESGAIVAQRRDRGGAAAVAVLADRRFLLGDLGVTAFRGFDDRSAPAAPAPELIAPKRARVDGRQRVVVGRVRCAEACAVTVRAGRQASAGVDVELAAGETRAVRLKLVHGAPLTLRVRLLQDGRRVDRAVVRVRRGR